MSFIKTIISVLFIRFIHLRKGKNDLIQLGCLDQFDFRNILCSAMHRGLPKGRLEDNHPRSSASRGQHLQAMMMDTHKRTLPLNSTKFSILNSKWRYMIISLLGEKLSCGQVLTKDSVTVSVDAVVYYRCNQLCHRAVTYFSTCDGDDVVSFPDPLFK